MKQNGSQIMIQTLQDHDIDVCWGYPGGAILPFYDELYKSDLKHILVRHEQGAVHAAEGYAKASGKIGVCIATSGPGATNLMTGIADAKMDSVPILAITGQVPTSAIGTDAFQEVDTYGMSIPITKYNALIKSADDVALITKEAILVALARRPGPALIDFPKDCQIAYSSIVKPPKLRLQKYHYEKQSLKGDLTKLIDAINRSNKPLLYVGGGAITANAAQLIYKLAVKCKIPVVSTLMGLGAFPGTHELSLGMLGMHGTAYANKAVIDCDFIFALGSRFDDRVAGDTNDFAHQAIKAQIDIDSAEIQKRVTVDIHIVGDLNEVLAEIIPLVKPVNQRNWVDYTNKLKQQNPLRFNYTPNAIKPQDIIYKLWQKTKGEAIIATDVGQHQMWAAQYYPFNKPRRWLTSGGLGTMGFGFPAGLGAKQAMPNDDVIVITGDGSFQMCIQELATAKMYNINVKILLFNNGFLGMVRQWQELFYENRFAESTMDYNPNFVKICEGFDLSAKRIESPKDIDKGLDFLLNAKECALLEVVIPKEEKVYPMVSSGDKYMNMVDFDASSSEGKEIKIIPNQPV